MICVVQESLDDAAPKTIDFADGTPLLRIKTHDLSRLEAAVKEQVDYPLLTRVKKHRLKDLPDFTALGAFF